MALRNGIAHRGSPVTDGSSIFTLINDVIDGSAGAQATSTDNLANKSRSAHNAFSGASLGSCLPMAVTRRLGACRTLSQHGRAPIDLQTISSIRSISR